jgi:hypothetical protein
MRYIRKSGPPREYAAWCTPNDTGWNPSWGALRGAERRSLVKALLVEQGHLCCYCNCRVTERPEHHHVEHLLPRRLADLEAELTAEETASIVRFGVPRDRLDIDYRNLLACCPNKEGKRGRSGCGDHKGHRLLPLTPVDARCETAFRYLLSGAVESELTEGRRAIQVLGLDRSELARARKLALEGWMEVALEVEATLPENRRSAYIERLLEVDPLPEFVTAATQLLRTLVPPATDTAR